MKEFMKSKIEVINADKIREQNDEPTNKHCINNTGVVCGKNVDVPIFHKKLKRGHKNEDNKNKR